MRDSKNINPMVFIIRYFIPNLIVAKNLLIMPVEFMSQLTLCVGRERERERERERVQNQN